MRNIAKILICGLLLFFLASAALTIYMVWMPNPDLEKNKAEDEVAIVDLRKRLKSHVASLSVSDTGRNYIVEDALMPARDYIAKQFSDIGLTTRYHRYELYEGEYSNIIVDFPSKNKDSAVLVIGAHYDSVEHSPGANDNASGVAALIELARYLASKPPANYKVRLIAFTNEEPPYFQTDEMGSFVYARSISSANESVLGMVSLEAIGYYTDEKSSQEYPKLFHLFYPDAGNFVSFVGDFRSRELVTASISLFRKNSSAIGRCFFSCHYAWRWVVRSLVFLAVRL